jgi:hypothetical protein
MGHIVDLVLKSVLFKLLRSSSSQSLYGPSPEVESVSPALVPTLKVNRAASGSCLTIMAGERSLRNSERPDRTAIYLSIERDSNNGGTV